jgi:hypothetical protein
MCNSTTANNASCAMDKYIIDQIPFTVHHKISQLITSIHSSSIGHFHHRPNLERQYEITIKDITATTTKLKEKHHRKKKGFGGGAGGDFTSGESTEKRTTMTEKKQICYDSTQRKQIQPKRKQIQMKRKQS